MSRIRVGQTQGTSNVNSFAFIQPDAGTTPAADSSTDTLTLTSSDSSITITGNSTTDTIDFVALGGASVTEYVEDAVAPANPTAPAQSLRRRDTLSAETDTDGDWVTANSTNKGEQYVKHVDPIPVTQSAGWTLSVSGGTLTVSNAGFTALQGTNPWVVGGTISAAGGTFTFSNAGITAMQGTNPWVIGGTASVAGGTITVSNAGFTALQGTNPWVVGGTISAAGGTFTFSNVGITALQGTNPWVIGGTASIAGGTVTVSNLGFTALQGTNPWVSSGTFSVTGGTITVSNSGFTALQGTDPWRGVIRDGINASLMTLRTPSANNLTGTSLISAAVLASNYVFNGGTWDAAAGNSAGQYFQGEVAHDIADTGRPVKIGFQARQTNPTAVADVDRTNAISDDIGRQIFLLGHVRDLVNQNQIGISNVTTAATLIVAGGAGVFHDLTSIDISNWSQVSTDVSILEGTSIMMRFQLAPKQTLLKTFPIGTGWKQITANTNWFAQLGATAVVSLNAQYVKNV